MIALVSIHDVAPPFSRQLHELWSLCIGLGVRPALLVVPDWHGSHPIDRDARFVNWLHARVDQGARILLHGERHDEAGSARGLADTWRALGRTAREGEFLSLEYEGARARIERGMLALSRCGLVPLGFVPPAWLARPATREAARDAGLAIAEDARRIYLLREGVALPAPAVRWSARSPWRAHVSALVADARWHAQRGHPLVRLALHPTDVDHPATRRSLERALQRWLSSRPADGYGSLARPAPQRGAA